MPFYCFTVKDVHCKFRRIQTLQNFYFGPIIHNWISSVIIHREVSKQLFQWLASLSETQVKLAIRIGELVNGARK